MITFDDIVEAMIKVDSWGKRETTAARLRVALRLIAQALKDLPDRCEYCGGLTPSTPCITADRGYFSCNMIQQDASAAADFVRGLGK